MSKFLVLLIILTSHTAYACRCNSLESSSEAYINSSSVGIYRIITTDFKDVETGTNPLGFEKEDTLTVKAKLLSAYKGVPTQKITFSALPPGSSCSKSLIAGGVYIFFIKANEELRYYQCSSHVLFSEVPWSVRREWTPK